MLTRAKKSDTRPRQAFTLIELLVVIAIIALVVGLTASATIAVIGGQRQKATETVVGKAAALLDRQWQIVTQEASKEIRNKTPPSRIMTMAGNDEDRARVIYIKLRLQQEFPVSADEIQDLPRFMISSSDPTQYTLSNLLDNRPSPYGGVFIPPAASDPRTASSACLYLALSRGRKGTGGDAESIFLPNEVADTDGDGSKDSIVDAWENPVFFFRWPTGFSTPAGDFVPDQPDPLDPRKTLASSAWATGNSVGQASFLAYCHPVSPTYNLRPVIVSCGKDGARFKTGEDLIAKYLGLTPPYMSPTGSAANDNIYSNRLTR